MSQELRLQTLVSEAHTRETSRGREQGARPRPGESPASEGTQAAAGPAPSPGGGDGSRSHSRLCGSLRAEGPWKGTGRVSLGPLEHIPATGQGGNLESRPRRDAVAQTKLGRREHALSVDPRVRAPRTRRATTYTKTPKSRARTPISMASSRMVRPERLPRRRLLVLSRRLPQLGRRRLARPGAASEARSRPRAGAGGGRRAGAGGGGEGSAQTSRLRPGGSATPRQFAGRSWPRVPAPSGRRLGDSRLRNAASALWARAVRPRLGRGSPGKPGRAAAAAPTRSPAPRQWADPEQRARWVFACGPSASPRSASYSRSPASRSPAHTRTWAYSTRRFGNSLELQAALGPSIRAEQRSLPCFLPSLHLSNLKFWFFSSNKFSLDHSQVSFCPQEVPARLQSPGTD